MNEIKSRIFFGTVDRYEGDYVVIVKNDGSTDELFFDQEHTISEGTKVKVTVTEGVVTLSPDYDKTEIQKERINEMMRKILNKSKK